jgi:hypothetical protein
MKSYIRHITVPLVDRQQDSGIQPVRKASPPNRQY